MRKVIAVIFSAALLGAGACSNDMLDVDIDDFSPLADFDSLNFSRVQPAQAYQYWELRYTFGPGSGFDRTLGSGGTRQRSELDAGTRQALDSSMPRFGFSNGCLPGHCYLFIMTVSPAGAVGVIDTRTELVEFLGTIDNVEEAALIVRSYNMYWSGAGRDTGYQVVSGGWEFLALELVRDCTPVQTDRVHVLVRQAGTFHELGREVHSKLEGACV